jgi:hypothetical protein
MRKRTTTRAITVIGALLGAGLLAGQAGARIPGLELLEAERTDPLPVVAPPPQSATVIHVRPEPHHVQDMADLADSFGSALASGDFNGDGHPDLAIGVPGEDFGATFNAGAVNVLYGKADGLESVLSAEGNQFWHAGNVDLSDLYGGLSLKPDSHLQFGSTLAAGDLNGDGYDDLAISVLGAKVKGHEGVVVVLPGSTAGLRAQGQLLYGFELSSCQSAGPPTDNFGIALAVGDFDGDGYGDLAVGETAELFCDETGGRVYVFRGWHDFTVLPQNWRYSFSQEYEIVPSGPLNLASDGERGDRFGAALAVGDFDGDGYDDLAIGAPGEDSNDRVLDAGLVNVVYGSPEGLANPGNQGLQNGIYEETARWSAGIEAGDRFGQALAVGDFDGDGYDDLAIGLPGEDIDTVADAGAIEVFHGGGSGLDRTRRQFWGGCCALERGYHAGDKLGSSLAAGDFDGNGYDDLAAGRPNAEYGWYSAAGVVSVIYGYASSGLHWGGNQTLTAPYAGAEGSLEANDRFGTALAALHEEDDSQLAIGVPYREVYRTIEIANAGTVVVPLSRSYGLVRGDEWHQDSWHW